MVKKMLAVKFELKPLFMLKLGLTKDFGQTLCKYDTYKKMFSNLIRHG